MRKAISGLLVLLLFLMMGTSAQVSAASSFYFRDTMSESVLRQYVSRAVTLSGLCSVGIEEDPIIEEDIRMLLRTGAKYIGRAAYYSWSGELNDREIERHYALAKDAAAQVHAADPEIILQAGVFEIIYKGTVNNTKIPVWVFKAFGLPAEDRNFRWSDMVFPAGNQFAPGFWGNQTSGVPCIYKTETQMYFYYSICRYIDAGFESIHLGQVEMMMEYKTEQYEKYWDLVLQKSRAYARTHARRGIVLFDCHVHLGSGGLKIGSRLLMDIQAAPMNPIETVQKDGALMCEISDYRDNDAQWIGRIQGGEHPLGFTVEVNPTLIEFDNYGPLTGQGVSNGNGYGAWGYDDVTWFALQPSWYRDQFLLESDRYLKTHCLDSLGRQVYFLQLSCRRVITPAPNFPVMAYAPGEGFNVDFLFDYTSDENTGIVFNDDNTFTLTVRKDYRSNRQSDGCPNGFGQEDTIRQIFLGENAPENPFYNVVVYPSEYVEFESASSEPPAEVSASIASQAASAGSSGGILSDSRSKGISTADSTGDDTEKPATGRIVFLITVFLLSATGVIIIKRLNKAAKLKIK
ncbi:MAG: hypothetical protein ACYC5K_04545 [Saccharofermentanales bacterium]